MPKNNQYAMRVRTFLNNEEHGGTAFIEAAVPFAEEHGSQGDKHFDAHLKIGDCNRVIELDFSVWGKDQVDEYRQKISRLRRTIVAFEKAFLTQCAELDR